MNDFQRISVLNKSSEELAVEDRKCVSHKRIYQYVWKDKKAGGYLYTHLRHKRRRYRKRGNAKSVEELFNPHYTLTNLKGKPKSEELFYSQENQALLI